MFARLQFAVLAAYLVSLVSCQVGPPPEPLPSSAGPAPVQLAYDLPSLTPTQEQQRQEKGAMTLTLEPVLFSAKVHTRDSGRTLFKRGYQDPDGRPLENVYTVRTEPYYLIDPRQLRFKVRIVNHHQRILRLAGTMVSFSVEGREVAVPQSGYLDFVNGILTPGAEKEFELIGPGVETVPSGSTVAVLIYDVVTGMDAAGTATEKSNFEWYFTYSTDRQSRSGEVTSRYERIPWLSVVCSPCGGSGKTRETCYPCGGSGMREDKKGMRRCTGCGGSGVYEGSCSTCRGKGRVLVDPEQR